MESYTIQSFSLSGFGDSALCLQASSLLFGAPVHHSLLGLALSDPQVPHPSKGLNTASIGRFQGY